MNNTIKRVCAWIFVGAVLLTVGILVYVMWPLMAIIALGAVTVHLISSLKRRRVSGKP